jgi:signal peptidase I
MWQAPRRNKPRHQRGRSRMTCDNIEERLAALENELTRERERRKQLEERVQELQTELDARPDLNMDGADVSSLTVNGFPLGQSLGNKLSKEDLEFADAYLELESRIEAIERGEVDPGEVVANSGGPEVEDLLPIHQMYLTVNNIDHDQHEVQQNQEIAARVFPYFDEMADPSGGRMTLKSGKVRQIIEREVSTTELAKRLDVEDPNPNTIRRAMKYLGDFGGDIIEFDTSENYNKVVADKDAWLEYANEVVNGDKSHDEVAGDGSAVDAQDTDDAANTVEDDWARLNEAEAARDQPARTDGGDANPR